MKNIFLASFAGSSFLISLISFGFALKNSIFPLALDFSLGLSIPDGFVSGTGGCFNLDGPATGTSGCLPFFKFLIFLFISKICGVGTSRVLTLMSAPITRPTLPAMSIAAFLSVFLTYSVGAQTKPAS